MKTVLTSLVFLALTPFVFGQSLLSTYGLYDSIPVIAFGDTLLNPWAGGLNKPQVSPIFLNDDTLQDLYVFDRDGLCSRTFIQTKKHQFNHVSGYEQAFPITEDLGLIRDYNNDGKGDFFTRSATYAGDLSVYKNVSIDGKPENLKFQLRTFKNETDTTIMVDRIMYRRNDKSLPYSPIGVGDHYIPAFVDFDYDGDLDIFSFKTSGTTIDVYENFSQDAFGHSDSLFFKITDHCWGQLQVNSALHSLVLNYQSHNCSVRRRVKSSQGSRHDFFTMMIDDLNEDSLVDILLGDDTYAGIMCGYSKGPLKTAIVDRQDATFPFYDQPVSVESMPGSYYLDIDGDDKKDLIFAPAIKDLAEDFNQVHYYRSTRRGGKREFKLTQKDFLVGDMIDHGTDARPLFVNVDGDSLIDILCGNSYVKLSGSQPVSTLAYYKNIGTTTYPVYELVSRDWLSLPIGFGLGVHPTAGDLDHDGDLDLIIGGNEGRLAYFENTSGDERLILKHKVMPWDTAVFAKDLKPFLFDFNEDGLLDLIMGSQRKDLLYLPNSGSASIPQFLKQDTLGNFGGIRFTDGRFLSPFLIYMDTTGGSFQQDSTGRIKTLLLTTSDGYLYHYGDLGTNPKAKLKVKDSLYLYTSNPSISCMDITGDKKMDVLFGHKTGGMSVLLKDGGNIIQPPIKRPIGVDEPEPEGDIVVYPNPVSTERGVVIIENNREQSGTVQLLDAQGRKLTTQQRIEPSARLEVSIEGRSIGLYYLIISLDREIVVKRLVIH